MSFFISSKEQLKFKKWKSYMYFSRVWSEHAGLIAQPPAILVQSFRPLNFVINSNGDSENPHLLIREVLSFERLSTNFSEI